MLLAGCYQAADRTVEVSASCRVTPEPVVVGRASIHCTFATTEGDPAPAERVHLEASMTHPGMRPVYATMTETEPGVFSTQIEFTMAGDWYLLVMGNVPGAGHFEETIPVNGVRADEQGGR